MTQPAITPQEMQAVLKARLHDQPTAKSPEMRQETIAQTLQRLGMLDGAACERIASAQKKSKLSFGQTARKLGLISKSDLRFALGVHLGTVAEGYPSRKIPPALFSIDNPYAAASDVFRSLVNKLDGLIPEDGPRRFCIAPDKAAVYTPIAALNLAATIAAAGKSTLLIDASATLSSIWKVLSMTPNGFAGDVMAGKPVKQMAAPTLVNRLSLLPFGDAAQNDAKQFSHANLEAFFAECNRQFDHVIILTDPRVLPSYSENIWAASRNVLVTLRKDQTRAQDLNKLKNNIRTANGEIIGAVILD